MVVALAPGSASPPASSGRFARALVGLSLLLAATACYPPIDQLVHDEPSPALDRRCSQPSAELGIAAAAAVSETAFPRATGATHTVAPGADLQAVLDAALPGDELILEAGVEYPGPLRLRYKPEPGVIVIRSSALAELPEGRAVAFDDRAKLATILAGADEPAVIAEERAAGYRLAGLELRPPDGVAARALMVVGSIASTLPAALPSDIVVDRSLIRGDPSAGAEVGIELNVRSAAVLDSRIMDIKGTIASGGGVVLDNAPGPVLVHGSVIEAAWRNVAIGERAPGSPELFPSDISICKSVLNKPSAWQSEIWATKALLEITRGRRVLVAGSVLATSWSDVHPGIGILLVDQGADDGLPTEDIAFVDMRLRDVNIAFDVQSGGAAGSIARLLVENSELTDVGDRLMRVLGGGVANITVVHTTALPEHSILDGNVGENPNLLLRDNLFQHGSYGIRGDGKGSGIEALDAYFLPWTLTRNIIVGADASYYPPDNFYPPTLFEAGVIDAAAGNYRLAPGTAYAGQASDGGNPGADVDRLEAALPAP